MYYIYVVKCSDHSLYTGIAKNIKIRIREHYNKEKNCAKYTRSHQVVSVEAVWSAPDKGSALRLEHFIKTLEKQKKTELIQAPELIKTEYCDKISGEYTFLANIDLNYCLKGDENHGT